MASESWLVRRLRDGLPRMAQIARSQPRIARSRPQPEPVLEHDLTSRAPLHAPPKRVIVCGDDPLAQRLVEELVRRYGVRVTAILPSVRRRHGPQIAEVLRQHGGRVVESERLDPETFQRAGVIDADALALVKQDDVGNINTALLLQELNPQLRLVIRMFNMRLGYGIRRLFSECRVLSDAQMAAPAFVSEALGEVAPVHVRVARRTLFVARRDQVRADDVICGLAVTGDDDEQSTLLPANQAEADLVLAVATGERVTARISRDEDYSSDPVSEAAALPGDRRSVRVRRGRLRRERLRRWFVRQRKRPFALLSTLIHRRLRLAALILVALLVLGTAVIAYYRDIDWWDAAYLALIAEMGGANPDLEAHGPEKIVHTLLTMVSIALIPVITAAVVEAVVNARLALALGRLRGPVSDHVVVVGLGNVGTRVMHGLVDLGIPVVVIDKNEHARGGQSARTRGIPFLVGDASQVETLRAASVDTCRALLVLSTDDVANLETALQGRDLKPDLRVVLRLFDGDFADRVQRAFGITASRSVSYLAAPAFAAALLEREVIGTIPVGRKALMLAEVPVCAGSSLDGAVVADAQDVGEVRVLALVTDDGRQTLWIPPPTHVLCADDRLLVVATRLGLGSLLAQTGGTVDRDAA